MIDFHFHQEIYGKTRAHACCARRYIFAELLDANTGQAIAGYTRNESEAMMNVSGTRLPLRWRTAAVHGTEGVHKGTPCVPPAPGCPVVGAAVQLRLFFRDATIYAVGPL
jgi:hypothetical protein